MKLMTAAGTAATLIATNLSTAFASGAAHEVVDTSVTYNSGILVLAFAGFLALVVVLQTIPAIMTIKSMIKQAAESSKQQARVEVSAGN